MAGEEPLSITGHGRGSNWRTLAVLLAVLVAVISWLVSHRTGPLPGLTVVASAPTTAPAYDRSCRKGHGCSFGPAWSDDVDVEGGHNGCDTRSDVLRASLQDVQLKPGTRGCVVLAGTLVDPYSGASVDLDEVQVDHVYPLGVAYARGASEWPLQRRRDFANDPRNLIATTASVNRSKSDRMPDRWLPATISGRCIYATRFVAVAKDYGLAVTTAENAGLVSALAGCAQRTA